MDLASKLRTLREIEGELRGLGRALTQGELVRLLREEQAESLSQSYLSQIESGARPHLTNTSRQLLARFFKVHPGYLVDDPEGYHPELLSALRHEVTEKGRLDHWLLAGAERFGADAGLQSALATLAESGAARRSLLLLESLLQAPALADRLLGLMRPDLAESSQGSAEAEYRAAPRSGHAASATAGETEGGAA